MIDSGEEDDNIICVPVGDPKFAEVMSIKDISPHQVKEIVHFFEVYKHLQGKKVKVTKVLDRKEALAAVKKGIKLYNEKIRK